MGIGRTATYDAIGRGDLRSVKVGRSRLIPADAIGELAQKETDPAATEPAQEAPHGRDAAPPTAAA
jgi:excisionase family DNA binding protein